MCPPLGRTTSRVPVNLRKPSRLCTTLPLRTPPRAPEPGRRLLRAQELLCLLLGEHRVPAPDDSRGGESVPGRRRPPVLPARPPRVPERHTRRRTAPPGEPSAAKLLRARAHVLAKRRGTTRDWGARGTWGPWQQGRRISRSGVDSVARPPRLRLQQLL